MALVSWHWYHGCGIIADVSWVWNHGSGIVAMISWLRYPGRWSHLASIWEASGGHLGASSEHLGRLGSDLRRGRRLGGKSEQNHCVLQHFSSRVTIWCGSGEGDMHFVSQNKVNCTVTPGHTSPGDACRRPLEKPPGTLRASSVWVIKVRSLVCCQATRMHHGTDKAISSHVTCASCAVQLCLL